MVLQETRVQRRLGLSPGPWSMFWLRSCFVGRGFLGHCCRDLGFGASGNRGDFFGVLFGDRAFGGGSFGGGGFGCVRWSGQTMVLGNEMLDLGVDQLSPTPATEDAIVTCAFGLKMGLLCAHNARAQIVGGAGLARTGDVVEFTLDGQ